MASEVRLMVNKGYRSLATRTLNVFSEVKDAIHMPRTEGIMRKAKFGESLEKVASSGAVESLDEDELQNIRRFMAVIDNAIPQEYRPDDPAVSLDFSVRIIRQYYGDLDGEDLMKRARISESWINADHSGLWVTPELSRPKRVLMQKFYPDAQIFTVVMNLHHIYKAAQPEFDESLSYDTRIMEIRGVEDLNLAINGDMALMEKWMACGLTDQDFFVSHEILELAERLGADVEGLKAFVRANNDKVKFLLSYLEGDAYINQGMIITAVQEIIKVPVISLIYKLIALADALTACYPLSIPKRALYKVGVGICEYMRIHPNEREKIKGSGEFHKELVSEYFENER